MATGKKGPAEGRVRVRILPKDPLVARRNDLWPVEIDLPCATPGSGPTGPHAVVVDRDPDTGTLYPPARLLKNRCFQGLARLSNAKILDDFHFHQVNVWAIVERTLAMIEDEYLLARAVPWASQRGRLVLIPHAGRQQNAFYDRATGALHFCYFDAPDGRRIHTCLSHDIVAHELGHAVLDGLKPHYNEVSSAQTAGFHEYFGDAVAMMSSLATRETAQVVTRGGPAQLDPYNVVSAIASEFGAAIRNLPDRKAYLRGAWNKRTMKQLHDTFEEHDWSEVLTGLYYDLLSQLYPVMRRQVEAENGAAGSRGKREYYAMRALSRAATFTAGVMFRGLDYCPPVDLRFDEYARAVLRADQVAYPFDDFGIRKALVRAVPRTRFEFRQRRPPVRPNRAPEVARHRDRRDRRDTGRCVSLSRCAPHSVRHSVRSQFQCRLGLQHEQACEERLPPTARAHHRIRLARRRRLVRCALRRSVGNDAAAAVRRHARVRQQRQFPAPGAGQPHDAP